MQASAFSNCMPRSIPCLFYRLNRYESLGTAVLQLNKTVRVECELMRKYL